MNSALGVQSVSAKTDTPKYSVNFPITGGRGSFRGIRAKSRRGARGGGGRGRTIKFPYSFGKGRTPSQAENDSKNPAAGMKCTVEDVLDYTVGAGSKRNPPLNYEPCKGDLEISNQNRDDIADNEFVCRFCSVRTNFMMVFARHAPSHLKQNGIVIK